MIQRKRKKTAKTVNHLCSLFKYELYISPVYKA